MNGNYYALKEVSKFKLFQTSRIFSVLNEPFILKNLINYSFILNIISSFQDYENLYVVTTYYEGKPLEYYKMNKLSEEQIKFMSACVIQGLTLLREKKIIHRDIMMKNIVMDRDKYFNIIDFSYSIEYKNKNNRKKYLITYDMVSPPEMLNLSDYDYNSDYYRLGSMIYFLIFKIHPLIIKREKKINDIVVDHHIVNNYSKSCIDFMNDLLKSDYKKRIGYNNINELKNHSFFKGFNWIKFEKKQIISPFNFVSNNKKQKCYKLKVSPKYQIIFKRLSKNNFYKKLIKKFDYVNNQIIKKGNYIKINN